jgi:hypothetical protein
MVLVPCEKNTVKSSVDLPVPVLAPVVEPNLPCQSLGTTLATSANHCQPETAPNLCIVRSVSSTKGPFIIYISRSFSLCFQLGSNSPSPLDTPERPPGIFVRPGKRVGQAEGCHGSTSLEIPDMPYLVWGSHSNSMSYVLRCGVWDSESCPPSKSTSCFFSSAGCET